MGKKLHLDMAAEQEADEIGRKFRNSSDVVGDMSRAYGADLSSVKIHTDSGAADMVAQQGVDAFSTGTDVFFGRGAFNPGNADSRGLLAHELAHSLQQGVGGGMGAVQQSAPLGAAQGGWFSNWRARKANKKMMKLENEKRREEEAALSNKQRLEWNKEKRRNESVINFRNKFGDDLYDSSAVSKGYVLPGDLSRYGTAQNAQTRFNSKEARDLYAELLRNPALLDDAEMRETLRTIYAEELTQDIQNTEKYNTKDRFEMGVMRGQESGGMQLYNKLLSYHITGDMMKKVFNNHKYMEEPGKKDGTLKGTAARAKLDTTNNMNIFGEELTKDSELTDLLQTQAGILGESRFYNREAADMLVLQDVFTRGASSKMSMDESLPKDARIQLAQYMAGQLQGNVDKGFQQVEGGKNFLNLLNKWRRAKA